MLFIDFPVVFVSFVQVLLYCFALQSLTCKIDQHEQKKHLEIMAEFGDMSGWKLGVSNCIFDATERQNRDNV